MHADTRYIHISLDALKSLIKEFGKASKQGKRKGGDQETVEKGATPIAKRTRKGNKPSETTPTGDTEEDSDDNMDIKEVEGPGGDDAALINAASARDSDNEDEERSPPPKIKRVTSANKQLAVKSARGKSIKASPPRQQSSPVKPKAISSTTHII